MCGIVIQAATRVLLQTDAKPITADENPMLIEGIDFRGMAGSCRALLRATF
jgi:hypothetical protein